MARAVLVATFLLCLTLLIAGGKTEEGEEEGDSEGAGAQKERVRKGEVVEFSTNTSLLHHPRVSLAGSLVRRAEEGYRLAALLDFLVSNSSGRQVVLLHDLTLQDVAGVAGSWQRSGEEVSVFPYSPDQEWLTRALRWKKPLEDMRKVVVVCSILHTLHIFTQVHLRSLESASIRWLVVMEDDAIPQVLTVLREGTQMAVAARQGGGVYQLYSSFVASDNTVTLREAGYWRWSSQEVSPHHDISTPLHPLLYNLYSDFGGRQLRTAVVDNWPFFRVTNGADGSPYPDTGIDISLLDTLGSKLNFT